MGIKFDFGCMVGVGVNWGVRLFGKDVLWSCDVGMCVGVGLFIFYDMVII